MEIRDQGYKDGINMWSIRDSTGRLPLGLSVLGKSVRLVEMIAQRELVNLEG